MMQRGGAGFRRVDGGNVGTTNFKLHLQRHSRPVLVGVLLALAVGLLWLWRHGSSDFALDENRGPAPPGPRPPQKDRPVLEPRLPAPPPAPKAKEKASERVRVDVYMESLCPDTTNFVLNQLWPTYTTPGFKEIMDVRIYPFGKAECVASGGSDFRCRCQHGARECLGNNLMNCVIQAKPAVHDHLPVIRCLQQKDEDGEQRACLRDAKLDEEKLTKCRDSAEGRTLMAKAGDATNDLDPGLHFVPWVLVNGHRSEDGRETYQLKDAVCAAYSGPDRPLAC